MVAFMGGFARISNNEITILGNGVKISTDIDPKEARQTLEVAEANLSRAEGFLVFLWISSGHFPLSNLQIINLPFMIIIISCSYTDYILKKIDSFLKNKNFSSLRKSFFFGDMEYLMQKGSSYRVISLGFTFLTIGILSGAVWANEAWGFLVIHCISSGHFPLSNLYESLIFLSWSISIIHMIPYHGNHKNDLSTIIAPSAIFTKVFATPGLSTEMHQPAILVPALQYQWLMMNVSLMLLSYAALLCILLLLVALIVITFQKRIDSFLKNKNFFSLRKPFFLC
ncbi:hypothetical protein IEQ34_002633 [Dendrobium chrysotoxum]|uniref:Cytochrome c assembly protein domain-containing protein n=1 Tax=Dendrobium chrysotoxum TaxID=161865 RepID=A0AAV7HJV4_DENCH|nr:hypothetical protein IEQ34_002633 [Dendrobium chrysotoxum]